MLESEQKEEYLVELYKCYFSEKNLVKAKEILDILLEKFSKNVYLFDTEMLDGLKNATMGDLEEARDIFLALEEHGYS